VFDEKMGEVKVFTYSSFFLSYNSNQSIDYRAKKKTECLFDSEQLLLTFFFCIYIYAFLMSHFLTNSCLFLVASTISFRTRSSNAVKFFYKQKSIKNKKRKCYYFIDIPQWYHQHFFVMHDNYFVDQFDIDDIHFEDVHYIQLILHSLDEDY